MSVNRTDVNRVPGVSSTSISFDQPSKNIRREYISRSYSSLCTPYTYTELSCELTIVSFFFVYIPRLYCKKKRISSIRTKRPFLTRFFNCWSVSRSFTEHAAPRVFSKSDREPTSPFSVRVGHVRRGITVSLRARHAKRNERRRRGGVEAGSWRKINWKTHGVLRMPHPPSRS